MNTDIKGKIALVTGANSGLGKATAMGLAKMGAAVVMVCRNQAQGELARADIRRESGNTAVELILADLSSQQAIHHLVATFQSRYQHLHILVNNVGGSFPIRKLTVDDIEYSLAVNHLASFLLTNLLLDVLKASAPARIINVGTRLNTQMDFDDLQFEKRPYRGLQAYSQTKLGNIHFTYELARRLEGTGVTVNCVHPGVFKSNLGKDEGPEPIFFRLVGLLGKLILPDASRAAERILCLATSPDVEEISGKYFADKQPIQSPPQTYDLAANQRLWKLSEALTQLNVQ
jgi:NAD(P)-dependent dehydrogenase (short-subunit alcohol dehydrogenase family)